MERPLKPQLVLRLKGGIGIHKCSCGKEFKASIYQVNASLIFSCGCYRVKRTRERFTKEPGDPRSKSRLYQTYLSMKKRCNSPKYIGYKHYGGKGIKVCDEWLTFESFKQWAINNGYDDTLTIDRINNDKGYSPDNCRFVTKKVQSANRNFKKGISGYTGVRPYFNKWVASISIDSKFKYLGTFNTPEEASAKYEEVAKQRDEKYFNK